MRTQLEIADDFGWCVDWAYAMRELGDFDLAEEMLDVAFIDAFECGFDQGEAQGTKDTLDHIQEERYFDSRCVN